MTILKTFEIRKKKISRFNGWWNFADWVQRKSQRPSFIRTFSHVARQRISLFISPGNAIILENLLFLRLLNSSIVSFDGSCYASEIVRWGQIQNDLKVYKLYSQTKFYRKRSIFSYWIKLSRLWQISPSSIFLPMLIEWRTKQFYIDSPINHFPMKKKRETFHPVYFHESLGVDSFE